MKASDVEACPNKLWTDPFLYYHHFVNVSLFVHPGPLQSSLSAVKVSPRSRNALLSLCCPPPLAGAMNHSPSPEPSVSR